jgi:molybdopterin-guanine dinucleotide biosynthesis protein A
MWAALLAGLCRRSSDIVAVILAGGISKRFGRPKQRLYLDGKPILGRIASSLDECLEKIYVSAPSLSDACQLSVLAGGASCLVDADLPCGGPPRAMYSSSRLGYAYILLVPSDMPGITREEIAGVIHYSHQHRSRGMASIPWWDDGRMEFLLGLYSAEILEGMRRVCEAKAGILRTRAGDAARLSEKLVLLPVELLAPFPRRLYHVTFKGDEYLPRSRGKWGERYRVVSMNNKGASCYRDALRRLGEGDLGGAYDAFLAEHRVHLEAGLLHLAAQALSDAARLADSIGRESSPLWARVHEIYRRLEGEER